MDRNDPRLTAYVLGELDERDLAEVQAAIAKSTELQSEVERIRETTSTLANHFQAEPMVELSEQQRSRILGAADASHPAPVSGVASAGRRLAIVLIATAALVLVAVLASQQPGSRRMVQNNQNASENKLATETPSTRPNTSWRSGDKDFAQDASDDATSEESIELESFDATAPRNVLGGEIGGFSGRGLEGRGEGRDFGIGTDEYREKSGQRSSNATTTAPGPQTPAPFDVEEPEPTVDHPFGDNSRAAPSRDPSGRGDPAPRDPQATQPGFFEGELRNLGGREEQGRPVENATEFDPGAGQQQSQASRPDGTTSPPVSGPEETTIRLIDSVADTADVRSSQAKRGDRGKEDAKPKPGKTETTANKTWRRAEATPNASRLVIGDHDELALEGMQANVVIDGFRARVLIDCYYYNDRNQQLEGSFKIRLPNEASLYYFAFGQSSFEYRPMVDQLASNGFLPPDIVRASGTGPAEILKSRSETWTNVKEARLVPREKAAHAYSEVVRRRVDPALVEWAGAGIFSAKVFPLMPDKLHRIVICYDMNLTQVDDDLLYQFDVPADVTQCAVDLNVSALPGVNAEVASAQPPFTSGGRAYYNFTNPDKAVSVRFNDIGSVMLTGADEQTGEYFASRVTPNIPGGDEQQSAARAVFLLDTSLSSNPDKFNVWLQLLETTLNSNRDSIQQFGVLCFNIESHWWKGNNRIDNTPENVKALMRDCHNLALEGATDLRQALEEAITPVTIVTEEEESAGPVDIFLLSDGAVTWGDTDLQQMASLLKRDQVGSIFAYTTGMSGTATNVLDYLARETGGAVFSVLNEADVAKAATAHRQRPWQLLHASVPGGSDVLIAGRPQSIYPGQTLLVAGRGTPDGELILRVQRAGKTKIVKTPLGRQVASSLVARTYGQMAVGQLEDLQHATEDISVAYARHFRVTGQSCSLLMLESEADYQRFNIKPEDDVFVVRSSPAADIILGTLDEWAARLDDPKEAMKSWLGKLENTPGFHFRTSTALKLAVERMPASSFEVKQPTLECSRRDRETMDHDYFQHLQSGKLSYEVVSAESEKRAERVGTADALKALSSLVEQEPGDMVLARDVAFTAMQWKLSGQAYPLLRRVAAARPYQPQVYQALGKCLTDLGNADLAMLYYEIAFSGEWHERYKDANQIIGVEYLYLLNRIEKGELETHVPEFASARKATLAQSLPVTDADLVITMMWNTARTDVDLHVLEPSGEECYYKNRHTRSGGRITADVTEGFGPEMYSLRKAKPGLYKVMANYFGSDANRTGLRSKVYVTVYEHFGDLKSETATRHTVTLSEGKEKRDLVTVKIAE